MKIEVHNIVDSCRLSSKTLRRQHAADEQGQLFLKNKLQDRLHYAAQRLIP
jgi:hypothetical protein